MPIHKADIDAFFQDVLAQDYPDELSGIDLFADICGRLRELLDEHDAMDDECRVLFAFMLRPFMRADNLSSRAKWSLLQRCAEAFGAEVVRVHWFAALPLVDPPGRRAVAPNQGNVYGAEVGPRTVRKFEKR
jgi:hypothetical protein